MCNVSGRRSLEVSRRGERNHVAGEKGGSEPRRHGDHQFVLAVAMRAEDHQVFHDQYVVKIENGNFALKGTVNAKDLIYKPDVDLTKIEA